MRVIQHIFKHAEDIWILSRVEEITFTDVLRDHVHYGYNYILQDGSISFGSGQVRNFTMHDQYRVFASEVLFLHLGQNMAQWLAHMEDLTCDTVISDRSADPRFSQ